MHIDADIIGYCAATLTTSAFIPQAIKTIRSRDTRAISLGMYVTFTSGIVLWFVYGLASDSLPIILSNALTFLLAAAILMLKIRYR